MFKSCFRTLIQNNLVLNTHKMSGYTALKHGKQHSKDYQVYLSHGTNTISSWHDIPLYASTCKTKINMIVEIPRWTNAKMEISKDKYLNPIVQDIKKDKLRYVNNIFPYKGYIWNYGAIPQTWEDPEHKDENTSLPGDNDPLDIIEIGQKIFACGDVIQVKPLGVLAMIDEGETDWKVVAIACSDPLADQMNDIDDVEKLMPGYLDATREWFKKYKVPQGKPENSFAFDGKYQNKEFAMTIINQTNKQWMSLWSSEKEMKGISRANLLVKTNPYAVSGEEIKDKLSNLPKFTPSELPKVEELEKWFHLK